MADGNEAFRLAAIADLHCRQDQHGRFRELVKMVNGEAEGLVLAGDLTDHGTVDEAKTLAEAFSILRVPCASSFHFQPGALPMCLGASLATSSLRRFDSRSATRIL